MDIKDAVFVFQMHEERNCFGINGFTPMDTTVELHYFVGGDRTFINGNKRYSISSGSLFLTTAETTHQIEASIQVPSPTMQFCLSAPNTMSCSIALKRKTLPSWNRTTFSLKRLRQSIEGRTGIENQRRPPRFLDCSTVGS